MSLEKTFEVLEYADKYFKVNNDEIIFSIDMTAEALLDSDKIIALDDKFAEYENLYIPGSTTEKDIVPVLECVLLVLVHLFVDVSSIFIFL